MADPADPWSWDAFDTGGMNAPAPTPYQPSQRKRKPLPDQREVFAIQRSLQKLGKELDALEGEAKPDLSRARAEYARAWTKLVKYLEHWKS